MRDAGTMISARLREQGWGRLSLDFRLAHEVFVLAELARSAIAESTRFALPAGSQAAGGRACHLVAGCMSAVLTQLGERRIGVLELSCSASAGNASGDHPCTFIAFSSRRRARVEAAIARGATTADAVVEALRNGDAQ